MRMIKKKGSGFLKRKHSNEVGFSDSYKIHAINSINDRLSDEDLDSGDRSRLINFRNVLEKKRFSSLNEFLKFMQKNPK